MVNKKKGEGHFLFIIALVSSFMLSFVLLDFVVIITVNKLASVKFLSWIFWLFIYFMIGMILVAIALSIITVATIGVKPKGSYYRFLIPIILCSAHFYVSVYVSEYMSSYLSNGMIGLLFLAINIGYASWAIYNMMWKKCPKCSGYHYEKVLVCNISSDSTVVSKVRSYTTTKTVRGKIFSGPLFVKNAVQVPYSYNAEITKNVNEYIYECMDCGAKSEKFIEKSYIEEHI